MQDVGFPISRAAYFRQKIKDTAQQQLKLLGSMGVGEMERKLEKTVLEVSKSNAERLSQQTGIEPSLSLDEVRQYLNEVLVELKNPRNQ